MVLSLQLQRKTLRNTPNTLEEVYIFFFSDKTVDCNYKKSPIEEVGAKKGIRSRMSEWEREKRFWTNDTEMK